ncbi:cytochrome P450 [Echria macrotheca]|uniref:Cytochrome P450 n=1 Tax=Echria macrotheca TaxID=438768 RepID=A0AAJ0BNG6_9PEZI|nr:cytochrome P450 [Echria macrotheca]
MSGYIALFQLGHFTASWSFISYLVVTLGVLSAYLVVTYLRSPLRHYPGPFLANFTNLWRMYYIRRGRFHLDMAQLHKKYGPVVRIAPNVLDVDDPSLIKTVFSTKGDWIKTGYYASTSVLLDGRLMYSIFSEPDEDKHAAEKRLIAKYYSAAGALTVEPLIDKIIAQLCAELETRFITTSEIGTAKSFDLGSWILYYAWDVVGNVTFSKPLGYLSAGADFDGTLRASEKVLDYFSWVGCMPWLDMIFEKNRLAPYIWRSGTFVALGATCVRHLISRYQDLAVGAADKDAKVASGQPPDYLDRFLEVKAENPGLPDSQVVSWIMINMGAGADTTAISIRSALYFSLRTPGVWQTLRAALAEGGLSAAENPIVSFKQARKVPYLDAVVRESIRYLPGVSLGLERYVPAGGQRLASASTHGKAGIVPEGSVLAFNPYILNRNKEIWGPDADEFRPERWLQGPDETEEAFTQRLRAMNDTDLSFGAGSRICIGKNMGLMQVYKVVATLALRYDIDLAHPEREWTVINSWFPRQKGLEVRMARRVR